MDKPLWVPKKDEASASPMAQYMEWLPSAGGPTCVDYAALWKFSVEDRETFWASIWDYCGVVGELGEDVFIQDSMPGAQWFPGTTLNFAENLLSRRDDQTAIIFRGEDGRREEWSRAKLYAEVGRAQAAMRGIGVGVGDRVAAILPNCPEAVVAMLATSALGAIWSSCSPDFGATGILDRFGQIEPKLLLACDGYFWKGKSVDMSSKLQEVIESLPTVSVAVLLPFASVDATLPNWKTWPEFLTKKNVAAVFEPLPFDHPLYIMFSSGTTGKPKCIVHGQGGTLLQHLKEHQLHTSVQDGDKLFYYTTLGWMMWNWLVTGLASGATLVLFDGNPLYPGPEALWDVAEEEEIQVFGTSAKWIDACKKSGVRPRETHNLSALRSILSTGSPLVPESFDWVYQDVKADVMLASISGGTDIVSCFVLGNPLLPVYRGEIQCRGLGMDVAVFSEDAQPVLNEPGELVCLSSFPSMPVSFWADADGSRYRAAYFETYPGLWRHGDWVSLTERGGMVIAGRSDATLNPGGVRIGTAEIYRQVEQIPQVLEAVVVGQDLPDGDQQVVLFVVLLDGERLTEDLMREIRTVVRVGASPRHIPAVIQAVLDIPRTRSGKISELAVRDVLHGRKVKNAEALANPEALQYFKGR
jgi:acetoacetyl-CoA synthetase